MQCYLLPLVNKMLFASQYGPPPFYIGIPRIMNAIYEFLLQQSMSIFTCFSLNDLHFRYNEQLTFMFADFTHVRDPTQ
jgi:hypothetical protein